MHRVAACWRAQQLKQFLTDFFVLMGDMKEMKNERKEKSTVMVYQVTQNLDYCPLLIAL